MNEMALTTKTHTENNGGKEVLIRVLIASASFFAGGGSAALTFKADVSDIQVEDAKTAVRLGNMESHYQEIIKRLDEIQGELHKHLVDVNNGAIR